MTVAELIVELQKSDPETIVVVSTKWGPSPLASVDFDGLVYDPETTWSGEVYDLGNDEAPERAVSCVLLSPTN